MPELKRVIYDIERCICHVPDACKDCSKYGGDNAIRCMEELLTDALTLLKAQEAKWISVKDRLPKEHDSMFAQFYGTSKWNGAMWRTESDRVLVAILFPDGTRTVDKGKLQDGEWRTGVARVLPQKVTHWALWPEPPKEES